MASRLRLWGALVATILSAGAHAQKIELGAISETYRLPISYTTLFRWDAGHAAVLEPAHNAILVLGTDKKLTLDRTFYARSGQIFPDRIQRYGETIYWASQAKLLGTFDTGGRMQHQEKLRGVPLSLDVRNGEARIVMTTNSGGVWEAVVAPDGSVTYEEGWMPVIEAHPDRGAWLQTKAGNHHVEVAAFLPIVRIDSHAYDLSDPCSSTAVTALRRTERVAAEELEKARAPWALAAESVPATSYVHVLLNGGKLLSLDTETRQYTCVEVPQPADVSIHTALAMTSKQLYVMTRTRSEVLVRAWPYRVVRADTAARKSEPAK